MTAQVHGRGGRVLLAAVLAGALSIAGCGDADGPGASPTATTTSAPTSPDDGGSTSPDATPTSPTPTTAEPTTPAPTTPEPTTPEPTGTAAPSTAPTPSPSPTPPAPTPPGTPAPTPSVPPATDLVQAWSGLDIEAFDTDRRVVALTFDGGASNTAVADILATLDSEDVPATFFVTGSFARTYPDSVRAMSQRGHPVGNHSDTHPAFPDSTDEEIRAELSAAEASISALTGRTTAPLFRFPFGDRTPLDIDVVNGAGYIPIRWTVDTLGWQGITEGITSVIVRDRVLDALRPGQVVLMHVGAHPEDGSTLDADALPGMIQDLRARGYGFVTVPDLLVEGR
ncbi:polysaccharide deacetylase family protein [Ornithinimicrobium sp. LYQ121]|uniref:polysaccharide deacetylase family protein n=1 Tax=Ornithinimicrobium sp. LYQ121 TaxID=3378801 RepID=UPI0038554364